MSKLMPWGANYTITGEIGGKQNKFALVPEITRTNLVVNPNFETNATGWTAAAVTLTRITTASYFGSACLQMSSPTAGDTTARTAYDPNTTIGAGVALTASCYFYNFAGNNRQHRIDIRCFDAGGTVLTTIQGTATTINVGSNWTRLSATGTTPANTANVDVVLYCQLDNTSLSNVTYVDAIMLETGSTLLPYFDGTYADLYSGYGLASKTWNGTANASTSTSSWYSTLSRRDNYLVNPNFETDVLNWDATNATLTRDTSEFFIGTSSLKLVAGATYTYSNAYTSYGTFPRVTPNNQYTFSYYAKKTVGTPNGRATINWYTDAGVYISQTTGTVSAVPSYWGRYSVTGTAPANARKCGLTLELTLSASGDTAFFDACLFEDGGSLLPYFDGVYANAYTGYALQYQQWNGTVNASSSVSWWYVGTSRTNLLPDPNMENASIATYWQAIKITESLSTDFVYSGTYAMKGVVDTASAGQYFQVLQTAGAMIDVIAGQTYTFSAYIYLPASNTADTNWRATLYFWNGTAYTGANAGTTTTITRGNWTRLTTTATVPTGYYKALPRIEAVSTLAVGQIAYVDAWLLEVGSTLLPFFDGVYADSYNGYTNYEAYWNGTANASTSTRHWRLTSAITEATLDGNWYLEGKILPQDITDRIQDVVISRGRNDPFQDMTAGRATLVLNNNDRALDPVNSSSPFWSTIDNASGVTLKRKVVIYYESTPIFTGLITDIDISYEIGPNNITISNAVFEVSDALADLASRTIEEYYPSVQMSGARVQTILALPEINYTGATSIDAGTIECLDDPISDQSNCLTTLQTVARTESGYLFAQGDGTLRFTNRIGPGFYTPSVFADNGTGIPYENLAIVYGEETLYNRVVVTPIDSTYSAVAQNTTSQTLYGIKTLSINGLLFSDADALRMADYLLSLYGTPSYRFNDMQLKFAGQKINTTNQAIIIGLDLGSVIRVVKTFSTGTPSSITQDAAIELVKHHITPTVHEIEFALAPALTVYPFELDDLVYGQLDSIYALSA